jgi:hypothetical protein
MEKQNVILALPEGLLKGARILAVKREQSLTEMVQKFLEKEIKKEERYRMAMKKHKKILEEGIDLGTYGKFEVSREDIHERG